MKKLLLLTVLALEAAAVVVVIYIASPAFTELIEEKARDTLFILRGPRPMLSSRLAVVAVGERSLDEQGRWPWPRGKMAALIKALASHQPKVIGLDVGFFDRDDRVDLRDALEISQRSARRGKPLAPEELVGRYHPDVKLAQAVAGSRAQVVLGYFFHIWDREVTHLTREQIKARRKALKRFAFPVVRYSSPQASDRFLLTAAAPENNLALIEQATRWGGFFNVVPGRDGVVRSLPMVIKCGSEYYPSLTLVMLARLLGRPLPMLTFHQYGLTGLNLGSLFIPTDEGGMMMINHRGPTSTMQTFEASDILTGRVPAGTLAGKAVLFTVTAAGVMDVRPTPFASQVPGGLIQLQAMDTILGRDFLVRTNWTSLLDIAALLVLALAAGYLVGFLNPLGGGAISLGLGAVYIMAVYRLFLRGYLLSLVYPLLALLGALLATLAYRYLVEERRRRSTRRAFQYYLSPSVITEVLKDPDRLRLGGEKRELTVMFADIRGFTTLSEKLDPEVLAKVLNTFTETTSEAILLNEGVLDKYIGDEVMAFFGAPLPQSDHAVRGRHTALAVLAGLAAKSETWRELGVPPISVGIGVNTGQMVVGNMGSSERFNYTVIGDNVNLASRLVGQTKEYDVSILVTQAIVESCRDQFRFRLLDLLRVKGKHLPVRVYDLMGSADIPEPDHCRWYEEAFEAHLKRDFTGALDLLARVLEANPADKAAQVLSRRCQEYREQPPPPDWDGVVTRTSK